MRRDVETALLTSLALIAFASNSLLTRLALAGGDIDAASYTLVRLAAGAVALVLLARLQTGSMAFLRGRDVGGPVTLAIYAGPFSFAYVRIGAALGALVLFGAVQVTMVGWGVARGERPGSWTWVGLAVAVAGLAALTLPSASARPDLPGILLMIVAGVAWGVYSLRGRGAPNPIGTNARNFVLALPFALALSAVTLRSASASTRGLLLAVLAGAVTSGVGYVIWYRALRGLTATRAATVQLSVPVIAAVAAVAFLGETATPRLVVCGVAILGGLAVTLLARVGASAPPTPPRSIQA